MVSVIIPCRNAGPYLDACLASVTAQSEPDLQILLVDDGSTDASTAIAAGYAAKDRRIKVISQEGRGVSAARNRGLDEAAGEFLLFLDADDLLCPAAVAALLGAMTPETDLVIGAHREFRRGSSRSVRREPGRFSREQCQRDFRQLDPMLSTLWGKLYRRRVILDHQIRFDEALPYCEDHVFNLEYCRHLREAAILKEQVYCYRLGGVASSLQYHPEMEEYLAALLQAYRDFFEGQVPETLWQEMVCTHVKGCILHEAVHRSPAAAREKAQELLAQYGPSLPQGQTGETLAAQIFREERLGILRKKTKMALWRRFQKRI